MKAKDNRERVIFRRDYDPYMKIEKYLACFPDDEANIGNIAYVPIYFNGKDERPCHDVYAEMPLDYYYKKKIIYKTDPIVNKLVDALKYFYEGEYKVVEKIGRR